MKRKTRNKKYLTFAIVWAVVNIILLIKIGYVVNLINIGYMIGALTFTQSLLGFLVAVSIMNSLFLLNLVLVVALSMGRKKK